MGKHALNHTRITRRGSVKFSSNVSELGATVSGRHRRESKRPSILGATAATLAISTGVTAYAVSPAAAAVLDVPVLGHVQVPVDVPGLTQPDFPDGPQQRTVTTIDGLTITLQVAEQGSGSIPSVDLLSREGLVNTHLIAHIEGLGARTDVSAKLSTGYTVGYPIQVAPNGVSVSVTTPQVAVSGGVNATLNPQVNISGGGAAVSIGSTGAQAGAQASLIPETTATFDVGAGGSHDVSVAETWLTSPSAELYLGGTHVVVSNAFGPVVVRPYATLTVTTANGVYDLPVYGTNSSI